MIQRIKEVQKGVGGRPKDWKHLLAGDFPPAIPHQLRSDMATQKTDALD